MRGGSVFTVKMTFLSGHYHATPWGSQVNEGLVEWPPSPWRISRALIATAFTKLLPTEFEDPLLRELINLLATSPPRYLLPEIMITHTRHFVPSTKTSKKDWVSEGTYKTKLMIDTYAVIREPLYVSWEIDLTSDQRDLAQKLFARLSYLGRAESWVEATVLRADENTPAPFNCIQDIEGGPLLPNESLSEVMSPQRAEDYEKWRKRAEVVALAPHPLPETKPSKVLLNKRKKATKHLLPDLFACLTTDSEDLKLAKWSAPPGSRKLIYRVLTPQRLSVRQTQRSVSHPTHVEAMIVALGTEHVHDVREPLTDAVRVGDRLHSALVSQAARGEQIDHEVLIGRTLQGSLVEGHKHLHIIPITRERSTHIDHLLLWSPVGLNAEAQRAVRRLRRLHGPQTLKVRVVGEGSRAALMRSLSGSMTPQLVGPSRVWESWTPFVPPRYLKERGKKRLEAQVAAELMTRGLICDPDEVEVTRFTDVERAEARLMRFELRRRRGAPQPPMRLGFGVRLSFKEPVFGPLALGYASHFGLGVFKAVN